MKPEEEFERFRAAWSRVPEPDESARDSARARLVALVSGPRPTRRRARGPQVLLAAALLLGLLGAVPALSGNGYERIIDWFDDKPSKPLVENLERLDQGAPPGMEQDPIVAKTGLVYKRRTAYGELRIWLTPTKAGGFCQNFEAPRADGKTAPFSGGCFRARLRTEIELTGSGGGTDFAAGFLNGRLPTVEPVQPNSAAISLLDRPSAAAKTIRQRNANACALFGRRAHRSSVSRSSPLSTTSARCAMTAPHRRR